LGLSFLVSSICLFAQEQIDEQVDEKTFSISTQFRPRGEYRNGAGFPRSEETLPATFVNNRSRLSMNYKRNDMEIRMSAQHVNLWGEDPPTDRNGRFMLNEAWTKIYFGKGDLFAQFGRQALVYDDERLLGASDWNPSGRFHDVLKLGFENTMNKLHLIFALNESNDNWEGGNKYTGGQPYKNMQTVWYNFGGKVSPASISLILINLGWQVEKPVVASQPVEYEIKYLQTFGTHINSNQLGNNLFYSLLFYYQTGINSYNKDVSAYIAGTKLGYLIYPHLSVFISNDFLTGQDINNNKVTAFSTLYGTNHRYYGTMDYFYATAMKAGVSNPGLNDIQLGINYKPSGKVETMFNYHFFLTVRDEITIAADIEKIKRYIGSEFDFQVNFNIMKDARLMAGYSFMLGTETMDIIKGGDYKLWQDWGWISINLNPQFFFSKWK